MRHHPGQQAAFSDGRRLREASRWEQSRRRAPRYGRRPHYTHHGGPHGAYRPRRHGPSPLLLLLAIPVALGGLGAAGLGIIALLLIGIAVVAAVTVPVMAVGTVVFVSVRSYRRRAALRRGGAAGIAPLPARPAAAPRPDHVWAHARTRFHALRGQYAAYECDAMQVLRLPALADVSVPSTARFVDAFAEAQALETDAFPPPGHAANFIAAVDRAERAWRAAREAAERIRHSSLTPTERGTVERVIKLLTTARDSDSDAERLTAYAMARSELAKLDRAGVVHLPRLAQAALERSGRGALPA